CTFKMYLSIHEAGVAHYNIQSQAGPGNITGIMCPEKWLEKMFLVSFGDTDTVVFYSDDTFFLCNFCIEFNKSILSRVFYSILDKINNAVLQQVLVQRNITAKAGMLVNNALVLFGNQLHFFCNFFAEFYKVESAERRFDPSGFKSFQR